MKILFNTHPLNFQHPGGGEVIIEKLAKYLDQNGVQVTLYNPWVHKIQNFDLIHEFHTNQWALWPYYKTTNAKLVVTPTLWANISKKKLYLARIKRILSALLGYQNTSANALKLPDLYLPTTEMEFARIKSFYNINTPYTVLPNGVDLPIDKPDREFWKAKLGLKDYFLFVGNISPVKNVDNLISVFNKSNQSLIIVGDANNQDRDYLQKCKEMANDNIFFVGRLDHGGVDLNNAFYGSKAVIIPSLFETCSLVGLEAAIRSIPIIITSEGATREIYEEDVFYINPFRLDDLLPLISDFQVDPLKVQNLCTRVKMKYTWDNIAKKLINIYRSLL